MSENMSQNTESDFLDQTFKDIDNSVSLEETEDNGGQEANKPAEKKGGISKNVMLLGGGVGVAVLLAGYWFLTNGQVQAPQPEQQVAQEDVKQEQPPISFNEPEPQPEQTAIQEIVPPIPTPIQDALTINTPADPFAPPQVDPFAPTNPTSQQVVEPVDPFASQNISSVVMPEQIPQLSDPVQSFANDNLNKEVNSVLEGAVVTPPESVEPIQAIVSNAPQTAHVDELRSLFDKHSIEIDKLDIRVTALEAKFDKSIQEQLAINKRVEERLSKLESGGVSKSSSSNSNNSSKQNASVKNTQRKRVKKASAKKITSTTSKVTVSNEPSLESTTIVDKRDVVAVAKPKQQNLEIHSVFSGRLWIKNSDSTLSTFAVGEAIPGGEKIKRIDEIGRKIYTDKRAISY
jgi:Skp family chaperone for outer membrane proteins